MFNYNLPFLIPKAYRFTLAKIHRTIFEWTYVTRPVCKTLTQTVTASLKRYGLLSEPSLALKKCYAHHPLFRQVNQSKTNSNSIIKKRYGLLSKPSLALKKCRGLTTVFDTHLL